MKKTVMTRAWAIRRENNLDMSTALRIAWFEYKHDVKKAYAFHMTDYRRHMIEKYLCALSCAIINGEVDDVHQIHKHNILGAALQLSDKNGYVVTDGKTVGLLKYAVRNGEAA